MPFSFLFPGTWSCFKFSLPLNKQNLTYAVTLLLHCWAAETVVHRPEIHSEFGPWAVRAPRAVALLTDVSLSCQDQESNGSCAGPCEAEAVSLRQAG